MLKLWYAAAFAAVLAFISIHTTAAEVDQQQIQFSLEPQPLREALTKWSEQAGMSVVLTAGQAAASRMAPRVEGTYAAQHALELLVAGSGLRIDVIDSHTFALRPQGDASPAKQIGMTDTDENSMRLAQNSPSQNSNPSPEKKEESQATKLDEIIVTARRRAENLRDVPMSISAIGADEISRRGLVNAEDYLRGIPGTNQVDSSNGQSIVIRGVESSPQNQNFGAGATTATYFGETPTTNSAGLATGTGIDLKLVDIARVEVLRGPQGTAFGDSSLGGAVRIIPMLPNAERFEGKLAVGSSSTSGTGGGNYNAQAVANIPLIQDRFAIRLVGYGFHDSGFYRNNAGSSTAFQAASVTPFGGSAFAVNQEEVGDYSVIGGRVAGMFEASDDLKFTLSYLKQKTEQDGIPAANSGTYEQTMFQVAPEHVVRGRTEGVSDTDIEILNPTVEYDLGWANLLATYSHSKSSSTVSQPYQIYARPWPYSFYASGPHSENIGELRLMTHLGGKWDFLAGGFVQKMKDQVQYNYVWFGNLAASIPALPAPAERVAGDYHDRRELTQKAVYGEVYWKFLPGFTLTGGARYYDYERNVQVSQSGRIFGVAANNNTGGADGVTPRANLSYKFADGTLVYAGWSKGFRLGKPQPGLAANVCDANGDGLLDGSSIPIASTRIVNSDGVESYELGGKAALFDRRLQIDAAAFHMEWSDIPVRVGAPPRPIGCGNAYVTNAGKAQSDGVEFQMNALLTDRVRLDAGGSYIHAKLTQDAPGLLPPAFKGDRLPGAPEFNANIGLQYDFNLAAYPAYVRADSIYVGSFYDSIQPIANLKAGDYVKLDLNARMTMRSFNVDVYVRNVTNQDAFTFRGTTATAIDMFGYRLRPRTFGLQLGYNF